ncbi:hypothetical protein GCM10027299_35190 [Larkinella ripae]
MDTPGDCPGLRSDKKAIGPLRSHQRRLTFYNEGETGPVQTARAAKNRME